MSSMKHKWPGLFGSKKSDPTIFERYVSQAPSNQNAIDAIPGWNTALPPECGVKAGQLATYADPRIAWAIERYGSLEGREVLELGPLEAGHTAMLERAGARVESVEANQLAYLRCLVAKEIMGLRARFWLGDFMKLLEANDKNYDLIVASGVLYHLADPLRLIELLAKRCSATYIWTHLVSEEHTPVGDPRRFWRKPEPHVFHGVQVRCYLRSYFRAEDDPAFCGGMRDEHRWINKDDLFDALRAVGFNEIQTTHEEMGHPFGPAMSIFARK